MIIVCVDERGSESWGAEIPVIPLLGGVAGVPETVAVICRFGNSNKRGSALACMRVFIAASLLRIAAAAIAEFSTWSFIVVSVRRDVHLSPSSNMMSVGIS